MPQPPHLPRRVSATQASHVAVGRVEKIIVPHSVQGTPRFLEETAAMVGAAVNVNVYTATSNVLASCTTASSAPLAEAGAAEAASG